MMQGAIKGGGTEMGRNHVREVVVHAAQGEEARVLAGRLGSFHAELIMRRLRQSGLPAEQQLAVLDRVMAILRDREAGASKQ